MDHIPSITGLQHPEIPLWATEDTTYSITSISELYDYPSLHGWNADLFMNEDFTQASHQRHIKDIIRFLQSWLFFALLSAALDAPVKSQDFRRQANGSSQYVLCTRALNTYLQAWIRRGKDAPKSEINRLLLQMSDAMLLIHKILPAINDGGKYNHFLPSSLGLSLSILGNTLGFALPQFLGRKSLDSDIRTGHMRLWGDNWPVSGYIKGLFARGGWCPNDLFRLSKMVSTNALAYAATMPRSEDVSHEKCQVEHCAANDIDEFNYRTKHVGSSCSCCFIGSKGRDAALILESGGIPLIVLDSWASDQSLTSSLEVVRHEHGQSYTAISHVWSDGLGNVEGNRLPVCQITRLQGLLQQIQRLKAIQLDDRPYPKVLFWMDTLCIPLEAEHRKLAIRRMAETYEKATQVLIIDSELRRATFNDRPHFESFARIAASGWMRRIWTLQEGVLASRLFVEFADGIADVTAAVYNFNDETNSCDMELNMVPVEFMSVIGLLQGIRRARSEDVCQCFINTWNSMKIRRTSKVGDEIICFASLLGLDVKEILSTDDREQRMRICISLMSCVPLGLLYTFGPKLGIDGYRWAPCSLFQEERIDPTSDQIQRDEKGLILTKPGLMLSHLGQENFRDQGFYTDLSADREDEWVWRLEIGQHPQTQIQGAIRRLDDSSLKLAVVADGTGIDAPSAKDGFQGALVSMSGKSDEGALVCRYECGVVVQSFKKDQLRQVEIIGSLQTVSRQKWHIG